VKAQVRMLKQPELFPELILRLSVAHDAEEAREIRLYLYEAKEAENA